MNWNEEEAELFNNLQDQEWRLNNLYSITDKNGQRIQFKMNRAQKRFFKSHHFKNIILKARQLGFSTFLQIFMLDMALFYPDTNCGLIAHTLNDAYEIFRTKLLFAYDNLHPMIREMVGFEHRNASGIIFSNGSSIRVGTSLRSGTYQYIHISEFGKIAARRPDRAEEIVTGTLPTLGPNGVAFIESTAEGQEGRFFDMVQRAKAKENLGSKLTNMDWKFHFYPWWDEPTYVLNEQVEITPEYNKYFDELESLHGVPTLSKERRAWYMKKKEEEAGDNMTREFPSHDGEAFAAAIEGAYFGEIMAKLERDGQVDRIAHNPSQKIEVFYDWGISDPTIMIFAQRMPTGMLNVIDYYENTDEPLSHYIGILDKWAETKGYRYSRHITPHDTTQRSLNATDMSSREEIMKQGGVSNIVIVPRSNDIMDGIEASRRLLPMCCFDSVRCAPLIKALKNYRREWNDKSGTWHNYPRHDWASHAADAFRCGAMAPKDNSNLLAKTTEIEMPDFGIA